MTTFSLSSLTELAPESPVKLDQIKTPSYGRVLEDFEPGEVFVHPRGLTISKSLALDFATTFMETNPLYLNDEFAKAHGFSSLLVSPLLVMNVALSLGVQNDSEKAIANLGYYNMRFPREVHPGDTLRAYTKVLDRKERGKDQPGIVTIRTVGVNQENKVVIQYDRKIMVAPAGQKTEPTTLSQKQMPELEDEPKLTLLTTHDFPSDLTGLKTTFSHFKEGDIIIHPNGRTITDEHYQWTYRVMNTHPLHYDRLYSTGREGKMSGEPIVYGGLVFAWLLGLASRDVSENALWDLGYTEGYHTQPAVSGDTITALSRVLKTEDFNEKAGIVSFQLIGFKNASPGDVLNEHGEDVFLKENLKKKMGKEKIPEKIFEIERKLLIKK